MCAKSVSSDDPNKLVASEGTSSECRSGSEDKNLVPSRGTRSEEKGKLVPLEGTGSPEPLYTGLSSPRGNQIYDFSEREQQVLRLAQRGFQLFPCKPRRKEPAIVNWRKLATADQKKLVHWFTEFPEANWAVATGPVSGVFVVDVDEAGAWSELCQRNGGAVETLSVRTTRGRHLYLRYPVESMICNSAKQIASGVDVRGQGGYALCPPSIHPSGTPYQWLGPESQPFAQPQSWLLDLIQQASGGMSGSKGSDCVEIVL
jgi:hypothetical protein